MAKIERQGLNQSQYAARCGTSQAAVARWKGSGRLVLFPDGSIDPDRSDALRARTVSTIHGGDRANNHPTTAPSDPESLDSDPDDDIDWQSLSMAEIDRLQSIYRAQKTKEEARIAKLNADRISGELLSAADLRLVWTAILTAFRQGIMRLGVNLAPEVSAVILAHTSDHTAGIREARRIIEDGCRVALLELTEAPPGIKSNE